MIARNAKELWIGSLHPKFLKAAVFTSVAEYIKYGWDKKDITHVIEKAAFDELVKENEALKASGKQIIIEDQEKIQKLREEREVILSDSRKLVAALELYDTYTDVLGGQTVAREAISEWNKKWGEK